MIVLHQTVAQGKREVCGIEGDPEQALALELVERGFVCIAPDAIGFGERIPPGASPYHDSLKFFQKHPHWSFMGKMVWDVQKIVDYLETLPSSIPPESDASGTRTERMGRSSPRFSSRAFRQPSPVAVSRPCVAIPLPNDGVI
jgi:hypothetical protein